VTVGAGGQSSASFTVIPSTYKHLQIRMISRDATATYGNSFSTITFNSDTSNSYAYHRLLGDGSAASAGSANTVPGIIVNSGAGAGAPAGDFGAAIIDILDYANTSKNKTIRSLNGVDINGTVAGYGGVMGLVSGLWMNTNAITSITLTPANANFQQYSQFALYGIKG
jgi:hypothetical protein